MKKLQFIWVLALIGLLAACAPKTAEIPFQAVDFSGKGYKKKIDNFLILHDASSSMFDRYQGKQKSVRAKEVILHMNDTLPALNIQTGLQDVKAGLRVFGPTQGKNLMDSKLIYGMTSYTQDGLRAAVNSVKVGGLTPLAQPLEDAVGDLKESKGKIAVILVSDGVDTKNASPVAAAEKLKKAYGDRICIYTILIGDDPLGEKNLAAIAKAGPCGFATTEAALATGQGMADFVKTVFLEKQASAIAKPKPVPVAPKPVPAVPPAQYETVTINLLVEFDFDKTTIRPREADQLDEFGAFLNKYPQTRAVLEGHTDNFGTKEYNNALSMRRAESVKKYLVTKFNFAPSRLSTKGFGYSRPIATNKTENGRQKNRRVEAVISTTVKK